MAKIKFRFTTECELTLSGSSYEEVYLQFKDLLHKDNLQDDKLDNSKIDIKVFPPEESTVYFEVENETEFHQIDGFKGDFKKDILSNCPAPIAAMIASH